MSKKEKGEGVSKKKKGAPPRKENHQNTSNMKIYIIEKGTMCQNGEIFRTYANLRLALSDFQVLAENKRKAGWVVTPGLGENTNNQGHALCGFWADHKGGNGCAEGYRLLELPVIE